MYNINQRWIKRISFLAYLNNFLQMFRKHWGVNNCHSSTVESTNRKRRCEEHQGSKQQEKSSFHPWTDRKSLKLNNEPSELTGKTVFLTEAKDWTFFWLMVNRQICVEQSHLGSESSPLGSDAASVCEGDSAWCSFIPEGWDDPDTTSSTWRQLSEQK